MFGAAGQKHAYSGATISHDSDSRDVETKIGFITKIIIPKSGLVQYFDISIFFNRLNVKYENHLTYDSQEILFLKIFPTVRRGGRAICFVLRNIKPIKFFNNSSQYFHAFESLVFFLANHYWDKRP